MTGEERRYCIDASFLIDLGVFDPDIFGGVWNFLSDLATKDIIHAPHEVLREVLDNDNDAAAAWVKKHRGIFFDPDDVIAKKVSEVQDKYRFYDPLTAEHPSADPFLVAHGIITGCTVVHQEKPIRPPKTKAKIPDACAYFKVRDLSLNEFFRERGVTFEAKIVSI